MHPAISAIPNHFLYGGSLRDGAGVEDDGVLDGWYEREWGYDSPVLLVDTGSLNAWVTSVNNAGRTSRLNFLSATACVDIAEMLLLGERIKPDSGYARILIGAPYRPQAKLINLLIREHELDPEVRTGTAHTFQGSEAPVMIFDLVNDEPHWKVAMFMPNLSEDFKRLLNVALTRAQRRLIIVGDFDYISCSVRPLRGSDLLVSDTAPYRSAALTSSILFSRARGPLSLSGGTATRFLYCADPTESPVVDFKIE